MIQVRDHSMKSPDIEASRKEISQIDLDTLIITENSSFIPIRLSGLNLGMRIRKIPYFLARNELGQLVGFGRLHFLEVRFRGTDYAILGLATILAIEKGKGIGRSVVEDEEIYPGKKMTAIGFAIPKIWRFMKSAALGVIKDGTGRFDFPTGPKSAERGDVVYLEGEEGLIEGIINHPGEKVQTFRPEW
jgi:hypothetical protein